MDTQIFQQPAQLRGTLTVPGDKSVSHRALLLSAIAEGETAIRGLADGHDVQATRAALEALGAGVRAVGDTIAVRGHGLRALRSPDQPLDCGNSGTTMRLLMGLLSAAEGVTATLCGDASLSRRPMQRVAGPLATLGAQITLGAGGLAPVRISGQRLQGGRCELAVASAQVKSALLLAGLHASSAVSVREPQPSRDHTERMLRAMGARLDDTAGWLTVTPGPLTAAGALQVPGDPSSAAFAAVAAALHPNAWVRVDGIGLNPTRSGWLRALQHMGAHIQVLASAEVAGEPCGSVAVHSSRLGPVHTAPHEVPALIDELPVLALAAAAAEGTSRFDGIGELRVKESDRLDQTVRLLQALGVTVRSGPAWLEVDGAGSAAYWRGAAVRFDAGLDHRMAMSAAVAGLCGGRAVEVHGMSSVATSWPGFVSSFQRLSHGA